MRAAEILLESRRPHVVGSFGNPAALGDSSQETVRAACDLAEIRLDLLAAAGVEPEPSLWRHLTGIPLLFTARRIEEGGALALDAAHRADLLRGTLGEAAFLDVEAACIGEMRELLDEAVALGIRWIASFHDFEELPDDDVLLDAAERARTAGAAVFKLAAKVSTPAELARLVEFQLADHGLPVATMGMGALAPASRMLCAQAGSVLNYGYLGEVPTAPGQWEAGLLRRVIRGLEPISR